MIPPARAANGLAIGNILICAENGEFELISLSIVDDDGGDDLEVSGCGSLVGGGGPGEVGGASQDVLSDDGAVGTIRVNSNMPNARVRLDLSIDGVSITGTFNLSRVGNSSCKKVAKKVSSCSIASKTATRPNSGKRQVAQGQPAPRRGLRQTSRVKRDKPVYRFSKTNTGAVRRIT